MSGIQWADGRSLDIHERASATAAEAAIPRVAKRVDSGMLRGSGLRAIRKLKAREPRTNVLVLTAPGHRESLDPIIDAGVRGCIGKNRTAEELVIAVDLVAVGRIRLPRRASQPFQRRILNDGAGLDPGRRERAATRGWNPHDPLDRDGAEQQRRSAGESLPSDLQRYPKRRGRLTQRRRLRRQHLGPPETHAPLRAGREQNDTVPVPPEAGPPAQAGMAAVPQRRRNPLRPPPKKGSHPICAHSQPTEHARITQVGQIRGPVGSHLHRQRQPGEPVGNEKRCAIVQ